MIYEKISNDHERASELLLELSRTREDSPDERERLRKTLQVHLRRHTEAEERVFYPALEQVEITREFAERSLEDHENVDRLLSSLEAWRGGETTWALRLAELRAAIEDHVDFEETELFDRARQTFSDREAEELGRRFEETQQQFHSV